MYISTASQFMDKQIMDLSNSHNSTATNNTDFIDFLRSEKKEDVAPSYDFMPIRPAVGSSSPSAGRSLNFDSGEDNAPVRAWISVDSKKNVSPIRNYSSLDTREPTKFDLGKSHKPVNVSSDLTLVQEIDMTMKRYVDDLMHAMDGLSARLSQLETKTHNLEGSMDELKVSLGNNHGSTDGKIRQMANVLREVQTGVQFIKDKQEAVESQFDISKLIRKVDQEVETRNTPQVISQPPPNAPPPQQNFQPPNQFTQSQIPSAPQPQSYFPPPDQTPGQFQIPPSQHHQPLPPPPPPQHHQPPPPPPPQQHQYQPQYSQTPPLSQPQPQTGHLPKDPPYTTPQTYQPPTHRPPPPQQFYGPTNPGYSPPFAPTSGHGESYPNYSSSSTLPYGGGSPWKPQQSGGSGYPQLPTARILPQALPTASGIGGGSGSGSGSGNRIPVDDVVDNVTSMGFSREQVRAAVQRLTENGQAVDLNVVLDKLMNDGDVQAPRGWRF